MYSRNKRELFKEKCLIYLGGKKCKRCGVNHLHIHAYDFHHVKGNKDTEISKMANEKWSKVQSELDKCVVLCKNCHAETHAYR
jgi:hypothetical protein